MQATASASIQHNTQPSERLCGGCRLTVESESGGVVVAFGSSLWHVDCFKCAKCSNRVTADTNLLLLSDGSPVCTSCSYNCNVCKKPILDEAIMTGEESYHAACFTCRTCSRRIDELVFAKTSQGIYCMACHNERVARSRRHAEAKKKAKNAAARKDSSKTTSGSRLRENAPGPIDASRERQVDSPLGTPTNGNTNTNTPVMSPSASGHLSPSTNNSLSPSTSAHSNASQYFPTDSSVDQPNPVRSPAPIIPRARDDSLPPQSNTDDGPRRQSAEESPRSPQPSAGLAVPTSRQDRRRSMLAGAPLPGAVSSPDNISRSASPQIPATVQSALPWARDDLRGVSPARPQPPSRGTSTEEVSTNLDASSYGYPQRSMSLPESARSPPHHVSVDPIVTGRTDAASVDPSSVPPSVPPKEVASDAEGFSPATVEDQQAQPNTAVIAPSIPPIRFSINEANILELLISADDSSADERDDSKPTNGDLGEMLRSASPHTPGFSPGLSEGSTVGSNTVTPMSAAMDVPSAIILNDYDANDEFPDGRQSPSADGGSGSGHSSFDHGSSDFHSTVEGTLVPSVDTHDSRRKSALPKDMPYVNGLLGGGGNNRATANGDIVARRLREALADSNERNVTHVKLDTKLVEAILEALQQQREGYTTLKSKLDGMRRASQQVIDGLSVAQSEYDQELATRREAQAEVQRLKAQLHGQNARLTQYTAEEKTREMKELLSKDLNENLHGLQHDVAKLKVERDLTLAEMEELNTTKQAGNTTSEGSLSRSLTTRLEGLKNQYRRDLEPLTEQREALQREVAELKQTRDVFLEEVTALNARNEELVELNRDTERRLELLHGSPPERPPKVPTKGPFGFNNGYGSPSMSGSPSPSQSFNSGGSTTTASSASTIATMVDDRERDDVRYIKASKVDYLDAAQANARKGFKWNNKKPSQQHLAVVQERGPGGAVVSGSLPDKPRNNFEHSFQQISVLRVARCDHCNDKMWGSQLRCSNCSTAIHTRCIHGLQTSCRPPQYQSQDENVETGPLPPALFGRDLIEQTRADAARGDDRSIPVIVEKCINAVERSGMDYEGIYRKSGGSSLSKSITALFERGNYDSFDLEDTEVFNDISSITSVLKSYFRALPNPLLTHALHEQFIGAANIREAATKTAALADLVHQLPREHFQTLQFLMLHLHRVQATQEENLMNARNLGVVFGPTLMRSNDSGREFADMAGKAMTIEWLIEHANVIFADQ